MGNNIKDEPFTLGWNMGLSVQNGSKRRKQYHPIGTIPKSNNRIVQRKANLIPLIHIYT